MIDERQPSNSRTKTNTSAHRSNDGIAPEVIEDLRTRKAGDIIRGRVKTIDSEATIRKAVKTLAEREVTGLPVVKGTRLVGIITEKDVLNLILRAGCQSGHVADHMTTRITTFGEEDSLGNIFDCLMQKHFRRVPILRDGKITGIISRGDLIRVYLEALQVSPSGRPAGSVADTPTVREVMTPGLLTTRPHASVLEAMGIIVGYGITGLPVVDGDLDLVGMVSEKDLLELFHDPDIRSRQVGDLMSYDLTAAAVNTSVLDVCECLANTSFRRLPVVEGGKLVGIISRSDLIMFILKNPSVITNCKAIGATGTMR